MQFQDLKLNEALLRAVREQGYTQATPIQVQAIPYVLAGRDLIGCAQTGTGKTAAFSLPMLQRLHNQNPSRRGNIRALILTPTRELATQIGDNIREYGRYLRIHHLVIFGGVGQHPQVQSLQRGVDILVATPGRLLDLMQQGHVRLDGIEIFVLDEADRMLDMGFIHDVKRVIKALPVRRQNLLFSATMPKDIQDLADQMLDKPAHVEVTPQATTVEKIEQSVFFVDKKDKRALLEHILADRAISRTLVFTRTKHGANKLVRQLDRAEIQAEAIHGDKSQGARERALANFKSGKTRVLVATDIASRGLDVDDVTHVINYDLPNEPESYVHRIGRTARAGASGIAFSFCDAEEMKYLRDIERLIRLRVPVVAEHPYVMAGVTMPAAVPSRQNNAPRRQHTSSGNQNNDNSGRSGQSGQSRRGRGGSGASRNTGRSEASRAD